MEQRVPPQDEDAELAVIGAALLDPRGADLAIEEGVTSRAFYHETNRLIWESVHQLRADGLPADPIVVASTLRDAGHHEAANAIKLIAGSHYTWTNVSHHARIVLDCWRKRGLIRKLGAVTNAAWNGSAPNDLIDSAYDAIREVEEITAAHIAIHAAELGAQYLEKLENPPDLTEGIETPFTFLPPMQKGRVYVLAGYQKDGKTAAAVQFALHASRQGKTVGYVTMEMTEGDLFERAVATYGIPYPDVQAGVIPDFYAAAARDAIAEIGSLPIHVIPDPHSTPATISALCHRHKWDLVIVDHFHRIEWKDRIDLEKNMRHLVNLTLKQRTPMLLLCQLSRPDASHPNRKPTMQSLRESGMLEAEASAVWIIYRPRDDDGIPGRETDFLIAASRYSETGRYDLEFDGTFQRFTEGKP